MALDHYSRDKAAELISEHSVLASDRGTLESHWQEIAERMYPAYSNTFTNGGIQETPGAKKTDLMFDSTAAIALGRFGSILDSLLTPRNSLWHKMMASDPKLAKNREVRLWFEEVTRLLFRYRYSPKANFASQNQQNYESLGAFGTGCVFVDGLPGGGLRYKAIHVGQIYFRENHQGIIDSAYRYFPMTYRQAAQKFGIDNLPEGFKNKLNTNPDSKTLFLHSVKPRNEYDPERLDSKSMPLESCYVAIEGKKLIDEGGYTVFPYAISRYKQGPGEVYGRSPAMDALPAIKTLNEEKKTILKQGHRSVDPIILLHDDGLMDTFSMKPGAMIAGAMTADGRSLVGTLPVGNINIGKELMDDERAVINDAFLVTLFQVLTETNVMTATEVLERTREKGILLNPTLGRQQSEYLGPMVEIEVDTLSRQGLLPPMPKALRDARGEYDVQYDSPLSRAARAEEAAGAMRTVETALQIVNVTQDKALLHHFNFGVMLPEIAEINGTPERWMNDPDTIESLKEQDAAAAEQEAQVQAAPGAAALMNAATKAGGMPPA